MAPIVSRLRRRPVLLDKDTLVTKAVEVAMRPGDLAHLAKGEREQVEPLVKALSAGSGWSAKRVMRPGAQVQRPQAAAVVAARAHQLLGPSSSVTPVDIAVALQTQGLDWVEPFAPGTPLTPFYGYGRRPRQYDYTVGRNVTTDTRPDRIPFATLKRLFDGYDVARTCTRHSINDLRSMRVRFEAMDGYEDNPVKEIAEAKRRLRKPDKRRYFKNWLAQNMLDLWRYDSAPIYRMRDKAGNVTALKNISAPTIAPMLDYWGDFPESPAPAFQQFIEGVPWDWLTWDDLIYEPFWPETESPYGTPPLETVLINSNTDVRLQLFFLQFFTAGSVPEALAVAPEDMTSPDDIADFQEQYSAYWDGDQSERWGLKWLPHGTELNFYKPQTFDPDLAEYVERRSIAAFGLTPQDLGILSDVNRATSATQMDTQFRISTLPIVGYYEDLVDAILQDDWNLPVQIRFDTGREKEDRLMEAQAHQLYVQMGAESPDEVREKVLGHPINPEERVPRFVLDNRLGIIPLAHILAVSGEVDQLTGAPVPGTVKPQPYELPGGGAPVPAQGPAGGGASPKAGSGGDPTKVYPRPLQPPNVAAKSANGPGASYDEPDQEHESPNPGGPDGLVGYGFMDIGSTAQGTGAGVSDSAEAADLRRWRMNARKAVARDRRPRRFEDSAIRSDVAERVWARLAGATTREQVDAAFKVAGPKAAGVVVQAQDTGRVLMVQRTPDKHDPDEAYARWEFPGGGVDGQESPWEAASREFAEEVGSPLPSVEHVANWTSPDGVYVGFVVSVPGEATIALRPDPHEVSRARWVHRDDLADPEVRDKVTDTLDRIVPLLKGWADQPRDRAGHWRTDHQARLEQFHRHTDAIIDHYAPRIEAAMADVFDPADLERAARGAYGMAKAAPPTPSGRGTGLPPNQAAAVAGVAGVGGTAAGAVAGAGAAGAGVGAAVAALAGAGRTLGPLTVVLTALYGEAAMQGAAEAAAASHGQMPPWTAAVALPSGWPQRWSPGVGAAAAEVAGGALADVLRQRDHWIREITDTEVDRIAAAIGRCVDQGLPLADALAEIDAIVHDAKRAWLIAETEYARAMGAVQMETYRANHIAEVDWLAEPSACHQCKENEAASPQPTASPAWPNGPIPVHPHERCSVAPHL